MDEASRDKPHEESNTAIDTKLESIREGTPSSAGSSPEQDAVADAQQQPSQPPKRKGGRKPIYATSEERKQRNRQAQAAFRERRTEYIKQLEATIKQNEDSLSTLQQSHRTAADECLMLRYKNSLLERILLEKGIDVRSELQLKTGSPILGPPFAHPGAVSQIQQTPLQRTALHRQHARRSAGHMLPGKHPAGQTAADLNFATASPQGVPTPSSHASSPTNVSTRSPMAVHSGDAMTPPITAMLAQGQHQQQQLHGNASRAQYQHGGSAFFGQQQQTPNAQGRQQHIAQRPGTSGLQTAQSASAASFTVPQNAVNMMSSQTGAAAYYPSPFQKHIDQLEQEYDTEQRTMLDRDPSSQMHGIYIPSDDNNPTSGDYYQPTGGPGHDLQTGAESSRFTPNPHVSPGQEHEGLHDAYGSLGHIDPNDPMLDADPFGLSASMHFPTAYSVMSHSRSR